MTISITQRLADLSYPLPTVSSTEDEKKSLRDIWKKIIVDGEGFVSKDKNANLQHTVVTYLKHQSHCKGNFVAFSDQFCKEILLELVVDDTQKERIFTIFKTLAQGYLEGDRWGMRDRPPLLRSRLRQISFKLNLCSILQNLHQIKNISATFIKAYFFPSFLATTPIAFSRYRTAQQCHIGITRLALKLGLNDVESKAKGDILTGARVARSSKVNDVTARDPLENIANIKNLQAHRIVSTVIRITLVALFIFAIINFSPALVSLFLKMESNLSIFIGAIASFGISAALISSMSNGTVLESFISLSHIFLKLLIPLFVIMAMTPSIIMGIVILAPPAAGMTSFGSAMLLFLLSLSQCALLINSPVLKIFEEVEQDSHDFEESFYSKDFNEDSIKPLIDLLSKGVEKILDPLFKYI